MYAIPTVTDLLKMKVAHTFIRDNIFYYQRRVPDDLRDRYKYQLIKISLKTSGPNVAARKVAHLNQKHA